MVCLSPLYSVLFHIASRLPQNLIWPRIYHLPICLYFLLDQAFDSHYKVADQYSILINFSKYTNHQLSIE